MSLFIAQTLENTQNGARFTDRKPFFEIQKFVPHKMVPDGSIRLAVYIRAG
ncbi:hypothetical protein D3C79_931200 [compost metagenome]